MIITLPPEVIPDRFTASIVGASGFTYSIELYQEPDGWRVFVLRNDVRLGPFSDATDAAAGALAAVEQYDATFQSLP